MSAPDYDRGLCRSLDPEKLDETFFYRGPHDTSLTPSAAAQRAWGKAKEFCEFCPIRMECRDTHWGEEFGVWGGTDQHERHLYRRKQTAALERMAPEKRAAIAAKIAAEPGTIQAIVARTGYSDRMVRALIRQHEKAQPKTGKVYGALSPEETERVRSLASRGESIRYICAAMGRGAALVSRALAEMQLAEAVAPDWPMASPPGDAWVWHDGLIRHAFYLGESADGAWFFMQIRAGGNATKRWFTAMHVDMRSAVTRAVLEMKGRSSEQTA